MSSLTSSVLSLTVAEQDALMLAILQSRSGSSGDAVAAPVVKKVKKSKKAESDAEGAEPKPKREQSEGQKAWMAFVMQCRDIVREATWETTFPYKNALSVASALKKAGKVGDAADKEAVLAAYHEYRIEHPASDAESVASAKKEKAVEPAVAAVAEPDKKVVKKKVAKKPEAPFHGKWTHKGTEYERDDLAIYTLQGKWVGRYDPKKDEIDTTAAEPSDE